jgi:hypothetical protein
MTTNWNPERTQEQNSVIIQLSMHPFAHKSAVAFYVASKQQIPQGIATLLSDHVSASAPLRPDLSFTVCSTTLL